MAPTICQDSKCEEGGNGMCCHECPKFEACESSWKCDEPIFYDDCKINGSKTDIFDWSKKP